MSDSNEDRIVVNAHTTAFFPYDLEGPVQPEMTWLPISFDRATALALLCRAAEGEVRQPPRSGGLQGFSRDRNLHSQISVLRMRKGDVVRRPFLGDPRPG